MIFVPSKEGISHAPDECTAWEDVTAGVRVLAATVCDLDLSLALGRGTR
jgi:acetylornithine deacetylase/succinyl-diaminopimelate desuccinylase-like protein